MPRNNSPQYVQQQLNGLPDILHHSNQWPASPWNWEWCDRKASHAHPSRQNLCQDQFSVTKWLLNDKQMRLTNSLTQLPPFTLQTSIVYCSGGWTILTLTSFRAYPWDVVLRTSSMASNTVPKTTSRAAVLTLVPVNLTGEAVLTDEPCSLAGVDTGQPTEGYKRIW